MERRTAPAGNRYRIVASVLALLLAAIPLLLPARPAQASLTFVVTLTDDRADRVPADNRCDVSPAPGLQCTLRAAIQEANATFAPDTIAFDIPGGGVKVIRPNDPATPGGPNGVLPAIARPLTIDGYTQPGASPNTAAVGTDAQIRIELDGTHTSSADGLRVHPDADGSSIRGLAIGRFGNFGIVVAAAGGVRVTGCFLGTDAAGLHPRPNGEGIRVDGSDVVIGNSSPAARNLISGNRSAGVFVGIPGTGARVLGNLIGTDRTGTAPIANTGDGIVSRQIDTRIGGDGAGEANVVQFNTGDGVVILDPGTRNRILRNAIGANGRLGIDLNGDGPSANDAGDGDAGANGTQNHPLITAATSTLVRIGLNSVPNETFFVRLYSNPGSGTEGVRYHGTFTVTTGPGGNTAGQENALTPDPPIPSGRSVTATATRGNGDTSELSAPVPVT